MNQSASNPTTLTNDAAKGLAESAGTSTQGAAKGAHWVNGISYWQDYMTIIELEDFQAPGLRPAS
jgi:hypothetical protein